MRGLRSLEECPWRGSWGLRPFLLFFQFLGTRRVVCSTHDVLLEAQSNRTSVLWLETSKAMSLARSALLNGWSCRVFAIATEHWLRRPVLWSLLYMTDTFNTQVTYQMLLDKFHYMYWEFMDASIFSILKIWSSQSIPKKELLGSFFLFCIKDGT